MILLPPRPPLLPSEGVIWPPAMLKIVEHINKDRLSVKEGEWRYFKTQIGKIDPAAEIRWKAESNRRRAMSYAVNFLSIEDLQRLLEYKKIEISKAKTPT